MGGKYYLVGLALAAFAISTTPAVAAEDGVCSLQHAKLICGTKGATRKDVFHIFSKPETTASLKALTDSYPLFDNAKQRESYRRSMEYVWRAVTRHARHQKRRYLRRRISKEAYMRVKAEFAQAEESYKAAINLYRYDIWQQSSKKARPAKVSD